MSSAVLLRQHDIIDRLSSNPYRLDDLITALRPRVSRRTVLSDLSDIASRYPERLCRDQVRKRAGGHRVEYRFVGKSPTPLTKPLRELDELELIALIAARGLLRLPDDQPGVERRDGRYDGALAEAIDRLIKRLGVGERAGELAPELVSVSRFGAAHEDAEAVVTVLRALAGRRALRFRYTNTRNQTHAVHATPQRLVLIRGEFHCFAYESRLKQYRVSRMAETRDVAEHPPGRRQAFLGRDIDDVLREGFGATGSSDPKDRRRIELLVSPEALPHLGGGRIWGTHQRWDDPAYLLPGWRRLSFTSMGLNELRHWALGMGSAVRAIRPPELVAWLREQATTVLLAGQPEPRRVDSR